MGDNAVESTDVNPEIPQAEQSSSPGAGGIAQITVYPPASPPGSPTSQDAPGGSTEGDLGIYLTPI